MYAGVPTVLGRRICITVKKQLALIPEGRRAGDEIWLLAGVSSPVVLQLFKDPRTAESNVTYKSLKVLVGQCYYENVKGGGLDQKIAIF